MHRLLITVKTYPTLSRKYGELVCTAGLTEDGNWIRVYPVPFRRLADYKQFQKYSVLEMDLVKNTRDCWPESMRPADLSNMEIVDMIPPGEDWGVRREWVLGRGVVHTDLAQLIEAANTNALSLATFRPSVIVDFIVEETEREWDAGKLAEMQKQAKQLELFDDLGDLALHHGGNLVRKLPYRFSYRFEDCNGRASKLMIEDWEIGQLFWNCLRTSGTEAGAIEKVREKYMGAFTGKDTHFFLGTTQLYHGWAKNPFVIIGVFYPPHSEQMSLFS